MDSEEGSVSLSPREQRRGVVLNQLLAGTLSSEQAAVLLGVSIRQLRRLKSRYQADGPGGLVHGNRGRQPWQALAPEVRARVLELAQHQYAGLNQQHLTEKLHDEGLLLGRTTVRELLLRQGVRSPRTRRPAHHRRRRERMPQAGLLVQADGSPHRWLGPDRPPLCLIGGIDDATGMVPWALFREHEDAQGYMEWLWAVTRNQGVPVALYVDRHGIFQRRRRELWSIEEELAGGPLPTQFGRVLQELGIRPIYALSPQAKGRVERLWGTLQDRLVAELRLAGVQTLAEANQFLPIFVGHFNARFAVPPAEAQPAWRAWPTNLQPERVFCFKYERVVHADNTVRFSGSHIQLLPSAERLSWARARVAVHEQLDGGLAVFYRGQLVGTQAAPPDAPTLRARDFDRLRPAMAPEPRVPTTSPVVSSTPTNPRAAWKPGPNHPWKRSMLTPPRTKSHDS